MSSPSYGTRIGSLRMRLRDLAYQLRLPRFWRWWMRELAPLVPAAPRSALQRRRARPVIEFGEGEAVIWRPELVDGALTLVRVAVDRTQRRCVGRCCRRPRRDRCAGGRARTRCARAHRASSSRSRPAGPAQGTRAAAGGRGESRAHACLRSRPSHAVSPRPGVFRRRRHRSRPGEENDSRRLGRGAQDASSTQPAPRRGLGRVP